MPTPNLDSALRRMGDRTLSLDVMRATRHDEWARDLARAADELATLQRERDDLRAGLRDALALVDHFARGGQPADRADVDRLRALLK